MLHFGSFLPKIKPNNRLRPTLANPILANPVCVNFFVLLCVLWCGPSKVIWHPDLQSMPQNRKTVAETTPFSGVTALLWRLWRLTYLGPSEQTTLSDAKRRATHSLNAVLDHVKNNNKWSHTSSEHNPQTCRLHQWRPKTSGTS